MKKIYWQTEIENRIIMCSLLFIDFFIGGILFLEKLTLFLSEEKSTLQLFSLPLVFFIVFIIGMILIHRRQIIFHDAGLVVQYAIQDSIYIRYDDINEVIGLKNKFLIRWGDRELSFYFTKRAKELFLVFLSQKINPLKFQFHHL